MDSRSHCPDKKIKNAASMAGVTLLEIVIALGIFSLISFSALTLLKTYGNTAGNPLEQDVNQVLSMLALARTQSATTLENASHGIYIDSTTKPPAIYALINDIRPTDSPTVILSHNTVYEGPERIVFEPHTGNTREADITLSQKDFRQKIHINSLGIIDW